MSLKMPLSRLLARGSLERTVFNSDAVESSGVKRAMDDGQSRLNAPIHNIMPREESSGYCDVGLPVCQKLLLDVSRSGGEGQEWQIEAKPNRGFLLFFVERPAYNSGPPGRATQNPHHRRLQALKVFMFWLSANES